MHGSLNARSLTTVSPAPPRCQLQKPLWKGFQFEAQGLVERLQLCAEPGAARLLRAREGQGGDGGARAADAAGVDSRGGHW